MSSLFQKTLNAASAGDRWASDDLLPSVYYELRTLAAKKLARERPGHTLQATALVHEAYVRIAGNSGQTLWQNRQHFLAAAAEAMRRILIDVAREKQSQKRGGDWGRVSLRSFDVTQHDRCDRLLAVNDALSRLEQIDPQKAELVKLRFFVGYSLSEAAEALGVSLATVKRSWNYTKAWLLREIES